MFHSLLVAITNLGDAGLLTALAGLTAALLYLTNNKRQAVALSAAFGSAVVGIALLKTLTLICTKGLAPWHLHSPSGHAALSFAAYGMLAVLSTRHAPRQYRRATIIGAACLIAAIAASRALLGMHSWNEVGVGMIMGALSLALGLRVLPQEGPVHPIDRTKLAAIVLIAFVGFYGLHLGAESSIATFVARTGLQNSCYAP